MIIGFPYQNRPRVLEEFDQLVKLGPSLWQILIYFAFPRTPLYEKAITEGRYLPAYQERPDYRTFDGFSMHFKHKHFNPNELENLQTELYHKCFKMLGPSLVRVLRSWFEGYQNMKDSPKPLLHDRAERMREYVRVGLPAIYPAILFGPDPDRRAEARNFLKDIEKEFGPLSFKDRLHCWATIPLSLWTWITAKLRIFQQPRLLRVEHRLGSRR
jgi:hypothetical protein